MRRGSVRLRLTLLFGGVFLVAGAALLGITYGLVSSATNNVLLARTSGAIGAAPAALPATQQFQAQALRYASDARAAENDALLLYSGIALAIMAVVSVALGWFAAGRALRPLRRITAGARRISATNLHQRLALDGPDDDLRELADTIDDLFARLDASFEAQRQFIANASHELRTPLARSRTLLEVALRDPGASSESLRAACERVLVAGAEQEHLIEALLTLARGQRGISRREPLDLAAVTRDVLAERGAEITARGLGMEVTLAPALMAGDLALSERAVANLIDNALHHNVPDGRVWVTVGTQDEHAVLTVANTGPVVPPGAVDGLLTPFRRGCGERRSARAGPPGSGPESGLGLGLSIVQAIAMAHGAAFSIAARPEGGGLAAALSFPAVHPAWRARADQPSAYDPLLSRTNHWSQPGTSADRRTGPMDWARDAFGPIQAPRELGRMRGKPDNGYMPSSWGIRESPGSGESQESAHVATGRNGEQRQASGNHREKVRPRLPPPADQQAVRGRHLSAHL